MERGSSHLPYLLAVLNSEEIDHPVGESRVSHAAGASTSLFATMESMASASTSSPIGSQSKPRAASLYLSPIVPEQHSIYPPIHSGQATTSCGENAHGPMGPPAIARLAAVLIPTIS